MRRSWPWLSSVLALCLGLLVACTPAPSPHATMPAGWASVAGGDCHVPPGGRLEEIAERGIGGTGGTTQPPPEPIRPSLGVAGIINGFGSVCLNGLEVGLLPGTVVTSDGAPATGVDLRIGQQAVLAAAYAQGRPVTDRLFIRHAVIGPIERLNGARALVVAGQTVRLASTAWIEAPLRLGQWVAVSGLPTPSGDILASRVDRAAGPAVLIHGRLSGTEAEPRIGGLPITALPSQTGLMGRDVVLRGVEDGGRLQVTEMKPDLLADDPRALFGGEVRHFLIQTLIGSGSHPVSALNLSVAFPPGDVPAPSNQPAVVSVEAVANGMLTARIANPRAGGWAGPDHSPGPSGPRSSGPGAGMNPGHGPPGTGAAHHGSAAHR